MRTVGKIVAMAALSVAALTGSAKVTMTVTSVEGRNVTLAFQRDVSDQYNTYELCLAYGENKGGDDKYMWDNFISNGTMIGPSTSSHTYTLPNDLTPGKFYRFFLLDRTKYDRELKYIATTSTKCEQYIDTGVYGKLGIKMEANIVWEDGGSSTILGARTGNNRFYPAYLYRWTPAGLDHKVLSWGYGFGTEWDYGTDYDYSYDSRTNNAFHIVWEAKTTLRKLVVNDKQVYIWNKLKDENDFNTGRYMYIFACNQDGGPTMGMQAKLYDMKIWENDVLVRSYRPVFTKGDAAAPTLYDEVADGVVTPSGSQLFAYDELPDSQNRSGVVRAMSQEFEVIDEEKRKLPVISYWVGSKDGDLADPANWCSTNSIHEQISAAPVSTTEVHFSGNVNACSASASGTLGAAKIFFHDVHLAGNCDLRAFGAAPIEGHLNLNGWKLQLAGLTGTGAITDRPFAVEGFQALAYIDSNYGVYIDTGVTGAPGVAVEIDVMDIEVDAYDCDEQCVVGSYDIVNSNRFMPFYRYQKLLCLGYKDKFNKSTYGFDQYKRYLGYNCMCNGSQNTYMNGLLALHDTISGDSNSSLPMYIFANNTIEKDGRHYRFPCVMRLYAARFWTDDGETLARDFVPARRMNGGALGLYDKMNGNFYEKQGSGSFNAGPVISAASGPAGELWVDVPEGVVNVNTNVVIAGSAKLVKAGKGTYRTEVVNHTYTGGTRVADGVFDQGVYSTNDSMPMGQNNVTVVFDKEADVEWKDGCYFSWGDEKPANTTFTLSQATKSKGFILIEHTDGIYIKKQRLYIFLR